MKFSRSTLLILAVLLALASLTACGPAGEVPGTGADAPGIRVAIQGDACPSIEINRGDQVTWVNEDTVNHTITVYYPDGSQMASLSDVQPGHEAAITFPEAGSFPYACSAGQQPAAMITVGG